MRVGSWIILGFLRLYFANFFLLGTRTRSMQGEVQLGPAADQTPSDSDPLLENQADSPPESSTEINDEDVESGSIPCCRICLETDAEPGEP